MDGRRRRRSLDTFDLGIGFFGFFAVAFFAISVFLQVTGRDATWAALPVVLSIVLALVTWRYRQRYAQRTDADDQS